MRVRAAAPRRALAALVAALTAVVALPVAGQQEQSFTALLDRLDRLERELASLRGSPPGAGASAAPASPPGAEARFADLEEQLRQLTDQVERATFGLRRLDETLSLAIRDIEERLAAVETAAAPAVRPPSGADMPETDSPGAGDTPQPPGPSTPAAAAPGPGGPPPALAPPPAPETTPEEEYERAFALLQRADYTAAEAALRDFVARRPDHDLAGNAWYWLGETHYARRDYERAAVAFARGYRGFPAGRKAPDNLLKLGMAWAALGQTGDACATFAKLRDEHGDASALLLDRLASEISRAGCP